MYLNEYLDAGHRLFNSTNNLCDETLLIGRFRAIYSTRTMRVDYTPEQIASTGQNVIDCNHALLKQLFDYAETFNPKRIQQSTTTKTGESSDTITDDATRTNTGDRTTTNDTTDTTTNTGTTSTVGNSSDTPNSTVSTIKSAYNATASRPYDTTTTSGTNTATSSATATDDLTATTKRTGTVTNADNLTETNTRDYDHKNDYSETVTTYGVNNVEEITMAFEKYIQPYDYLCKLIAKDVCELIW